MRRSFEKSQKQMEAKIQLLTIDEEEDIDQLNTLYDPLRVQHKLCEKKKTKRSYKARTEVSSPQRKSMDNYRDQLRKKLQKLKDDSEHIINVKQKIQQFPTKTVLMCSINFHPNLEKNNPRKIKLAKQKSEQKMRPLVIVDSIEEEEENIRKIIKQKILARDIFRKVKGNVQVHSQVLKKGHVLNKIQSEKRGLKKNMIVNRGRNFLPHIV